MPEILDHKPYIQEKCLEHFGSVPVGIERFTTGLCHYVYGIEYPEKKYVIRIADSANRETLRAGLYWLEKLDHDIPVPHVIVDGVDSATPYVIMNFIAGKDLGEVYTTLSEGEKIDIVKSLIQAQKSVEKLPLHRGYGWLTSYEDTNYKSSWSEVLIAHIERSRKRIIDNGIFDEPLVERVVGLLGRFDEYFSRVRPQPFLEDTSTKNVLIENGKLSGIIDIDWLCFGDKIYVVALTNMALLSMDADTDYVEYWLREGDFSSAQKTLLSFYTLIYCLDFMSEVGMQFNGTQPLQPSPEKIEKLKEIYNLLIEKI